MSIISRTSRSPNDLLWKAIVDLLSQGFEPDGVQSAMVRSNGCRKTLMRSTFAWPRGENSSEEVDLGAEQHGEDGSDKLSNDDGSEDSDEEREELSELAQVEVQSCVGSSVGGSRNLVAGGGLIGGGVIGGGRGGVLRSSIFRGRAGIGVLGGGI